MRFKPIPWLLAVVLSVSGILNSQEKKPVDLTSLTPIELLSKKVNQKQASIDDLATEAIESRLWRDVHPALAARLQERLVKAENEFTADKHNEITDIDVSRAVNHLATKLALPEYAKTSPEQVGYLRAWHSFLAPTFMTPKRPEQLRQNRAKGGKPIPVPMSPVQAVYITVQVLHQKMIDDDYLKTPEEWKHAHQQHKIADAGRINTKQLQNAQVVDTKIKLKDETGRQKEFREQLGKTVRVLSSTDMEGLCDGVLDDLGISRGGEK